MPASPNLRALFPWIPGELLDVLVDGYVDTADMNLAQQAMRSSGAYDRYYPGNRRPDGTVRYGEQEYAAYMDRARIAAASVGVNPNLLASTFAEALAADIPISELEGRIDATYERIIDRTPETRQFLANTYGVELSDRAILAMALDPRLGAPILENRITEAEIGGEAAMRGFGINLDLASQLRQRGVTQAQASQLFSAAAEQLPVLDVLARRHNDQNDSFDLNEFLAGSIFDDPTERARMRRLVAQERGLYGTETRIASSQEGALRGLQRT